MLGLIRRRRDEEGLTRDEERRDGRRRARAREERLARADEPHPLVAFAVGLVYLFRTPAGARMMRELEAAIRKYAADPAALWRVVREGEPDARGEVIDTTADEPGELPGK